MTQTALRIAFAGTPAFAAKHLKTLINQHYNIVAVYSQPDRLTGRGKKLQASPVKALALENNIPVHQPFSLKDLEQQEILRSLNIDVMIVVAYGLLLPQAILDIPRFGCLNVHASLLPRWRGAAPIERAVLAGDSESGISIMQMDKGLDTGDVLLALKTPLAINDTSETLTNRLLHLGREGLLTCLESILAGSLNPEPQKNALSLYANKLNKAEALIHWDRSALDIQKQVNAFYPRSPAYCFYNHQRIRIVQSIICNDAVNSPTGTIINVSHKGLKVACLNSSLLITKIQLAGKKEVYISDFLNGQADFFVNGAQLTCQEIAIEPSK